MSYDKRGFITGETVFTDYDEAKTINKSYTYDSIGRLTTAVEGAKTTNYTYDKTGNRLTMSDGTDSFTYSYNQFNFLTEIKKNGTVDSTFLYDARGNQISETTKKDFGGTLKDVTSSYTYDIGNRLIGTTIAATGETTQNVSNHFNGDGQQIKQTVNRLVIKYYYDSASLLYTTDHNNVKGQEHILDPGGSIVASKRFDGAYENMYFFYNYDIRGSVTNIIKPDGTRVKGYEYDEFGNTNEVGESQFKNDVKFTGAVHDTSTGLYYMNARFYNPSSGRFLSQDSYSGNPQDPWTQHLYAYCGNNPINMIDPTGHFFQKIVNLIKPATKIIKAAAKEVVNYPVNAVKGAWSNAKDRTNAMNANPSLYTIGNWLTLGTFDLAKATFAPEKPLSLQHWMDSLKMATLCVSAYSIISSSIPTKTVAVTNKVKGTSETVTYSPAEPGPLKQSVAETFSGATYKETVLTQDTAFYRVYGGSSGKVGSYMTRVPQNGGMQSQIDLAINPQWGNTAQYVTKGIVPRGTVIYEGRAASQIINGGAGRLIGGGNQIYISEVNSSWFK
ncbi:MAG TPA: hypothetical protein DIW17_08180 [Clostridiales bacterium]|nr:hypothetical protein [Clostridiales bacterium]